MSNATGKRIDEVSEHFEPAKNVEVAGKFLFWIIAVLSLYMPYTSSLEASLKSYLQAVFIVFVTLHFMISQLNRFYLIPKAERIRRQHFLSNAFGTPLTHEQSSLYYNNDYSPSIKRLGANTMENTLFSKETTNKMLFRSRFIVGTYLCCWLLAFALRHNNLETLTGITQILFSGEIVAQWINLEVLRFRCERAYDQLHSHFFHELDGESPKAVATILDAFVAYESAKASAGILLSSKVFFKINPSLTEKWERIRKELKMN